MGHTLQDILHDYWSTLRQLSTLFFSETMTRDRFLHILRFLHFADNSERPDQHEEYDRLWKLRSVFDTPNDNTLNSITPQGEEFDWRSWKKPRSPHPQFGWKTQVRQQQILCGSRAVIINTGQQNPTNSGAVYVQHAAGERRWFSSVPRVTWACAWCPVSRNITRKWISRPKKL
jgi:hypothetical protein